MGSEVAQVKVDAHKITEIARKLGVSERTVEEYLLERLTMTKNEDAPLGTVEGAPRTDVVDRFGRPLERDAG